MKLREKFLRDPWMLLASLILLTLLTSALVAPFFVSHLPDASGTSQFLPPGKSHLLGTDLHGRDLLARLLSGLRLSLVVGLIGASVSLTIGVTLGMISGYCGDAWDTAITRLIDILYSLPRLIIVIVLITGLEQPTQMLLEKLHLNAWTSQVRLLLLFVGLGLVEWLTMARIVRGQVLLLKEAAFVQASQALGQSPLRMIFRHLLPNLRGIIIVYLTLTIPVIILEESFLSFLGLGVQAPAASLGSLISEGAQYLNPFEVYWWLLAAPAGTMALLLLSLNLLGDGLRDLWDPRKKK